MKKTMMLRLGSGGRSWGERLLISAYCMLALAGAGVAMRIDQTIASSVTADVGPGLYDAWIVVAGAIGGMCGLFVVRKHLGHSGMHGRLRWVGAMIYGTFVAGVVGGTLALPLYGTMFGPFAVGVTLFTDWTLALVWVGAFVIAHLKVRAWNRERDSIFRAQIGLRPG